MLVFTGGIFARGTQDFPAMREIPQKHEVKALGTGGPAQGLAGESYGEVARG